MLHRTPRAKCVDGAPRRVEHADFEAFPPLGIKVLVGHPAGELRDTLVLALASDDRPRRSMWRILGRSAYPKILLDALIVCTHLSFTSSRDFASHSFDSFPFTRRFGFPVKSRATFATSVGFDDESRPSCRRNYSL